ncbi:MAG: lipid II flippase family protein [Clostridia bacterium]
MKLAIVLVFTALISMIETVSYAARLSGARTGRVGTSTSLFNILVVFSRFAVMIQLFFLASVVEEAINSHTVELLDEKLHYVLLSMSGGIVFGMLLVPTVARVLEIGTQKLDEHGSFPRILMSEGILRILVRLPSQFWLPAIRSNLRQIRTVKLGYSFFVLNAAIFSFYSIANLSALYAGAMMPAERLQASMLASVINGVGTILLVIFVDPISAKLLDDVVEEKRPLRDIKAAIFQLGLGRLLGTIVAQILLWPFATFITWMVWLSKHSFFS